MKDFDYKKAYEDLVKKEVRFIDSIEQHISMIYESSDTEHIMDLLDVIEKLLQIKKDILEEEL